MRPGIVDLWYYFYEGIDDEQLLGAQSSLMTPDERRRHGQFLFQGIVTSFLPLAHSSERFFPTTPP